MDHLQVRRIRPSEEAQWEALLRRGGLRRDAHLDYCAGIFDGAQLIGTGSCAGNTLRCLTVDENRQGEGLLNQVVQHLIQVQYARGNYHLFLYTKGSSAKFFQDLGFAEIARDGDRTVFMENRRTGFSGYLGRLQRAAENNAEGVAGGLVMNANPFTRGHQYLVEQAAQMCETLHLFVVSEDASVFPAADRMELVKAGTAHLNNIVYHKTEDYMISQATFPAYFLADDETAMVSQARLDASVFSKIAETLHISVRFLGTEPKSNVTGLYNQALQEVLPQNGIACKIVPRLECGDQPISASTVRQALRDGNWGTVESFVPITTLEYLKSQKGAEVVARLRDMENVQHH